MGDTADQRDLHPTRMAFAALLTLLLCLVIGSMQFVKGFYAHFDYTAIVAGLKSRETIGAALLSKPFVITTVFCVALGVIAAMWLGGVTRQRIVVGSVIGLLPLALLSFSYGARAAEQTERDATVVEVIDTDGNVVGQYAVLDRVSFGHTLFRPSCDGGKAMVTILGKEYVASMTTINKSPLDVCVNTKTVD